MCVPFSVVDADVQTVQGTLGRLPELRLALQGRFKLSEPLDLQTHLLPCGREFPDERVPRRIAIRPEGAHEPA